MKALVAMNMIKTNNAVKTYDNNMFGFACPNTLVNATDLTDEAGFLYGHLEPFSGRLRT